MKVESPLGTNLEWFSTKLEKYILCKWVSLDKKAVLLPELNFGQDVEFIYSLSLWEVYTYWSFIEATVRIIYIGVLGALEEEIFLFQI